MSCDRLIKEALQGIKFTYKLDDILGEIPAGQKFNAKQLDGYLMKRGVSPKEITQSKLLEVQNPEVAKTIAFWLGGMRAVEEPTYGR